MKILYSILFFILYVQIQSELIQTKNFVNLLPEHSDIVPNDSKFKIAKNKKLEKFYGRVLKLNNAEILVAIVPLLFFFIQLQMPIWMLGLFTFPLFSDYLKQLFETHHENQRRLNINQSFILDNKTIQRNLVRQIKSYTEQQFENDKNSIAKFLYKKKVVLTDRGSSKKIIDLTKQYLKTKGIKSRQIYRNLGKIQQKIINFKMINITGKKWKTIFSIQFTRKQQHFFFTQQNQNDEFINKMKQFEQNYKEKQNKNNKSGNYFTRAIIPLTILGVSYFVYQKISKNQKLEQQYQDSFNISYKSISSNPESILLSLFNYKNKEQMIIYYPFLVLSLLQVSFLLNNVKFLSLFTIHMFSQIGFLFFHENHYSENNQNFVIPKNNGSTLALFFSSFLATYKINSGYFGFKFLPFWVYPTFIAFFEYYELRDNYTREVCRQAHIFAILNGLLWGILFRKI